MSDTIFAQSSGAPPAAIGIIRISGPEAGPALDRLAGKRPLPRQAALRGLRADGVDLDRALVLWFPGPASATGEDCAELHCHGGRAVIAAVESALAEFPGLRRADPGEFTRRAFLNGRIDLNEAEGLADLLAAETEWQRRSALDASTGLLSREVERWREGVLGLSAQLEAIIDFSDEDDVAEPGPEWGALRGSMVAEIDAALARPPAERLRDGVRVVLAGPPNAGKSSLFNAILQESVAIVTPEAGTTRDLIERPVALSGVPFVLVDTAGLRDEGAGAIERIGIAKAADQIAAADIVLWLGAAGEGPQGAVEIAAMADLPGRVAAPGQLAVSALTGDGIAPLLAQLVERAEAVLPQSGVPSLNRRQRDALVEVAGELRLAGKIADPLVIAEHLRRARLAFDRLTGRAATEDMLDALFGRFCIGK